MALTMKLPMDSPLQAVAPLHRGSVDSNADLDEYFATYVPLSNLPTPPAMLLDVVHEEESEECDSATITTSCESDLSGPAVHLARLVPSNASVRRPCASTIQGFLYRSALPLETIALAACVLDALSFRFAHGWRQACWSQQLIPTQEVIVLAALSVATSVHDDRQWRARHWTQLVAHGECSTGALNTTTRCILQDLDYCLHSFTAEMLHQQMLAMALAVPRAARLLGNDDDEDEDEDVELLEKKTTTTKPKPRPLNVTGLAVEQHGLMTPEPEPDA